MHLCSICCLDSGIPVVLCWVICLPHLLAFHFYFSHLFNVTILCFSSVSTIPFFVASVSLLAASDPCISPDPCINTVWIFCFLRSAASVFILLLFQHASLRYLSFYYCVRVSEPLRAFPPFFELSSSPGWLSGLSYFLSPSVLLENIFTVTTVLLFISLVLLGLIQIDWCFDILPTVSEIFFFFFFW